MEKKKFAREQNTRNVIKSTHRILKKTNNAERGIVLRAEERGVRGSSERHDQKMRGDARDERYARALFFVSISLSLSSPRDTIKKRFTLMLLLAGIGSLVVIDELDAEKVHGIITHTDGERMYFHFFSLPFSSSSSSPSFLLFFFFFLDSPPPPPQTRKQPPMKKKQYRSGTWNPCL